MRKIVIAVFLALFSMTAAAQAQEAPEPVPPVPTMPNISKPDADPWRNVAVVAGAAVGIWAVNAATGGFVVTPILAAAGTLNTAALNTPAMAARFVLITAGAITGGYLTAWFRSM
jgi:hypothetical protein